MPAHENAGSNQREVTDSDRLDKIAAGLDRIADGFDELRAALAHYAPALDRAAKLADSPMGKIAARGWRAMH